ncbi:MAG: hypothetical protein IJ617_02935 [Oscillospiraceae bacterium]|nr:hypothetical protein [Oscillospiraceae bacterium]
MAKVNANEENHQEYGLAAVHSHFGCVSHRMASVGHGLGKLHHTFRVSV